MKREIHHIDWNLAGRILSGEASKDESEKFDLWLSTEEHRKEWNEIIKEFEQVDYALASGTLSVDTAWKKVRRKTVKKNFIKRKTLAYSAVAASVIFIIGVFMFQNINKISNLNRQFVQTQSNIDFIELREGSQVTLNKNSTFTYPRNFRGKQRNTSLQGEAYFSVTRNPEKPFIIHTNDIQVTVLGTSFNIKAYPESDYTEVVVNSGNVKVASLSNPRYSVHLTPGDKAMYNNISKKLIKSKNNNINYLAWKTKEITFNDEKFTNAIYLIEDVYNVSIDIPTHFNADDARITATFKENNIDFIIKVLNETYGLELSYETKLKD
jgi:ferric-dicitrate binding protein FerR (iron transport regulator)